MLGGGCKDRDIVCERVKKAVTLRGIGWIGKVSFQHSPRDYERTGYRAIVMERGISVDVRVGRLATRVAQY